MRTYRYTVQFNLPGTKGGHVFVVVIQFEPHITESKAVFVVSITTPILTFLLNQHKQQSNHNTQSVVVSSPAITILFRIDQATVPIESVKTDNDLPLQRMLAVQPNLIDTVTRESNIAIDL